MQPNAALATAPPGSPMQLALVVALGVERACLKQSIGKSPESVEAGSVVIVQSGQGALNAARTAKQAVQDGATALLSIGLAGALDESLHSGDVVVPDLVVTSGDQSARFNTNAEWATRIRACLNLHTVVVHGSLLSVSQVLTDRSARNQVAQNFSAVACDMESAAIASVAEEAGIDFAVVRVIADELNDEIPDAVEQWVDHKGNSRILPVLQALLQPQQWAAVGRLIRGYRIARRSLAAAGLQLASQQWCRRTSL